MKTKLPILLALVASMANAQWSKTTSAKDITKKSDNSIYYKLDINTMRTQLQEAGKIGETPTTILVPTLNGKTERFAVNSFPVMDAKLANQYQLGSYVGVGIDNPGKYIRFSIAPNDFQSMIIDNGKYEFIEPATKDKSVYSIHGKTNKKGHAFVCNTTESANARMQMQNMQDYSDKTAFVRKSSNQKFRTMRLAISTTGEYTQFFGGLAGALTQINATITRVNAVFEQEFNIHLNIINNAQIIFTDANTDPYSTVTNLYSPPDAWNTELMNVLHGTTTNYGVGDADFDIGHLFGATGGGGNAGCIGCVCNNSLSVGGNANNSYKGSGITSPGVDFYASGTFNPNSTTQFPPSGDAFDIDYVAHEMGHQLGDNHSYSFRESSGVQIEPGSGSTIMGYAGITGLTTDLQHHSDIYFSSINIDQVQANLLTGTRAACGTITDIANNPPVVQSMATTYTIPKSTAFVLTASATDADGDALTYCWEQVDTSTLTNGVSTANIGTRTSGGTFRSWPPTPSPTRYFPKLSTVLGGAVKNTADFEAASSVARTMNFRATVRDNKIGGQAQTGYATQTIVVGAAEAFTVNTATLIPETNSTVTWVVSGTTAAPYNVANVKIDYTSDNGATWTTLANSVPNTGSASVYVPASIANTNGHLRVSAIGNVFYAVKQNTVGTLAISESGNVKEIQIYPNPVDDVLNVKNISPESTYEIYNTPGQLIKKGIIGDGVITVSNLVKGVYFIKIVNKGTNLKTKFIKK